MSTWVGRATLTYLLCVTRIMFTVLVHLPILFATLNFFCGAVVSFMRRLHMARQVSHFLNANRCRDHNHGLGYYSCAIDVFLEISHYGIFCQDRLIQGVHVPFIVHLNEISRLRNAAPHESGSLREGIWDILEALQPTALGQKDTIDAKIDATFHTPTLFSLLFQGGTHCVCQTSMPIASNLQLLQYCQSVNELVEGQFSKGTELELQIHLKTLAACQHCQFQTQVNGSVCMPSFLFVELGLRNCKNASKPPTTVSRYVDTWDPVQTSSSCSKGTTTFSCCSEIWKWVCCA